MKKHRNVFKMPKGVKITGRSSTITNSFVNSIIPVCHPSDEEVLGALEILEMDPDDVRCSYCGDPFTEWDHFMPLVKDKKPTGYITEIENLVPSCGKCNQSKSGKNWKDWMIGPAAQSPTNRGVSDILERISRLERYETTFTRIHIDFESVAPPELWELYWNNLNELHAFMKTCQSTADELRREIKHNIKL